MSVEPAALPERVRARVLTLAADALGALPADQVPAALRRVAAFTPARRARAAGSQLLVALGDPDFRERLGVQVRARNAQLTRALEDGERTEESAALAFLLGVEGWEELAAEVGTTPEPAAPDPAVASALETARQRLEKRETELARAKEELDAVREELRTEKAGVRHRIGEARAQTRSALAEAEGALRTAEETAGRLRAEHDRDRAELEELRARLNAVEGELGRARREVRRTRETGTVRARLLLDTLIQAGQGLRQELGLPVVEGAPADVVVADLAEAGVRTPSGSASRPLDDPSRLRELLMLPGFHLVVDGYNVTRDSWSDLTLEEQRARLLRALAPLGAQAGAEVTVVFDGANADVRPTLTAPRGLRVVFSPRGVIADDVIRDFVAAEPPGRPIGVVTSDQEIVRDVTRRPGVHAVASRALVRLLG